MVAHMFRTISYSKERARDSPRSRGQVSNRTPSLSMMQKFVQYRKLNASRREDSNKEQDVVNKTKFNILVIECRLVIKLNKIAERVNNVEIFFLL